MDIISFNNVYAAQSVFLRGHVLLGAAVINYVCRCERYHYAVM